MKQSLLRQMIKNADVSTETKRFAEFLLHQSQTPQRTIDRCLATDIEKYLRYRKTPCRVKDIQKAVCPYFTIQKITSILNRMRDLKIVKREVVETDVNIQVDEHKTIFGGKYGGFTKQQKIALYSIKI